jgi:hypothetical protein
MLTRIPPPSNTSVNNILPYVACCGCGCVLATPGVTFVSVTKSPLTGETKVWHIDCCRAARKAELFFTCDEIDLS